MNEQSLEDLGVLLTCFAGAAMFGPYGWGVYTFDDAIHYMNKCLKCQNRSCDLEKQFEAMQPLSKRGKRETVSVEQRVSVELSWLNLKCWNVSNAAL